jgi:hypothetical protein
LIWNSGLVNTFNLGAGERKTRAKVCRRGRIVCDEVLGEPRVWNAHHEISGFRSGLNVRGELIQEADVVLKQDTHVGNAVSQGCNSLQTKAKGET